jgi:hypothetical protein
MCGTITLVFVPLFTVENQTATSLFIKEFLKGALAFVRGIWLPTGSNYLIYSGVSPGQNRLLPVNGYLSKQSKIKENILKINTYQQLKTIVL